MKSTLEFFIKKVIGEGVKFDIEETINEYDEGIKFIINIEDDYKSRLIGKGGRTINAISNLLKIIAKKDNKRVYLKIAD